MQSSPLVHIFIFSFNRGPWLKNCVESVFDCFKFPFVLTVVDDASDEYFTRKILSELSSEVDVRIREEKKARLGGLYENMQFALYNCCGQGIFFLQDDMQIVREVAESEISEILDISNCTVCSPFIHPCFLKGRNKERDEGTVFADRNGGRFYTRGSAGQGQGVYYSDVSLCSVDRLQSCKWLFRSSEEKNEVIASEYFSEMIYWGDPFAMWLPQPTTYRYKKDLSGARRGRSADSRVFRYRYMNSREVDEFKVRSIDKLPFAEDYLDTEQEVEIPWVFNAISETWFQKKARKFLEF